MKRILFYYPSNKRSVQIESTLKELKNLGHEILFLTTGDCGILQEELEKIGIKTYLTNIKSSNSFVYYIKNIWYLAKFSRENQIDLIFSNLQHANFIAVFAQFFTSSKVIAFRHHFKYNKGEFGLELKVNKNEVLFDKVINILAKSIVVPSVGVYNGMKTYEKVKMNKVHVIPYIYDFSKYTQPSSERVEQLKAKFPAKLRIIMVARLIPFKRHLLILPVYKKLIDEGFDLKVIILDEGPCKKDISKYIVDNHIKNEIILTGFTTHFLEYMMASDILIHPSLTEASNNVVKEIGLMGKTVAVCEGVGDFDEYLDDKNNGFLMSKENTQKEAEAIIRSVYNNEPKLSQMGKALRKTIKAKFGDNKKAIEKYIKLIDES